MKKEAEEYYIQKMKKMKDADLRFFERPDIDAVNIQTIKTVHFIGICGTAMGSLAGLFKEAGFTVSGSDISCYSPMDTLIKEMDIQLNQGFKEEYVRNSDLVVIGNAWGPENVEIAYARENNLLQMSMPEAIQRFFLKNKSSIVVVGTHGKTTTSGMLAHVFISAGLDPGFIIGGIMSNSNKNFRLGGEKSDHFILEGDEYDTVYFDKSPKFLNYSPTSSIITSVEFDHVDIYKDMEEYQQAFTFFVKELKGTDTLFLYGDDKNVRMLATKTSAKTKFYGLKDNNDITARNIVTTKKGQTFTLIIDKKAVGEIFVPLFGSYNLLNTLAVSAMSLSEGISMDGLIKGLKTFQGMKRRQEIRGKINDVVVIDDFAHHPTAVKETIKGMKERFSERRIIALFEPRSITSRKKIFEKDYGQAFDEADYVFLHIPSIRDHDDKEDFIDGSRVAQSITNRGPKACSYAETDDLLEDVLKILRPFDVVLIMSNGSFDNIHVRLLHALKDTPLA